MNKRSVLTASEAVDYLRGIQQEIRYHPNISIAIKITRPYAPFSIMVKAFDGAAYKTLHYTHGDTFEMRITKLKRWWENNQEIIKQYNGNN